MGGDWGNDVREVLRALEAAQHDLSALYDRKRTALVGGRSEELLRIAADEAALGNRLRELLDRRGQILEAARRSGLRGADSLVNLVRHFPETDRGNLEPQIDAARRRSEQLRRETWVQWIIAHRAYSHYSGLLELIAHNGGKSPTYEAGQHAQSAGGALFDASI